MYLRDTLGLSGVILQLKYTHVVKSKWISSNHLQALIYTPVKRIILETSFSRGTKVHRRDQNGKRARNSLDTLMHRKSMKFQPAEKSPLFLIRARIALLRINGIYSKRVIPVILQFSSKSRFIKRDTLTIFSLLPIRFTEHV